MLEYSGILLLVKLEKMDVKPLKYFYPPVISFYNSSFETYATFVLSSAKSAQSEVHEDRHDVLLYLPGPLPPLQPDLLVERVQLEARHLGGAQHPGQIQPRVGAEAWGRKH